MNFEKGQIVFLHPYEDPSIEVSGYVVKVGRTFFSKKRYIKIKGMKYNSFGDIFSISMKVYEHDWHKVKMMMEIRKDGN